MRVAIFLIPAILILMISCEKQLLNKNGIPCKKYGDISIIKTIPDNCDNLGIVADHDYAGNINDMLKSLKKQAAGKCADAVFVPDSFLSGNFHSNMVGQCIKYK
jgi:hypothetical protein